MEKVIVRAAPTGKVEIEADGFKGEACTEATKNLIKAVGPPTDDKPKPERYETVNDETHVEQAG